MTEESAELARFRSDVRAWLADNVPRDWRSTLAGASPEEFVAFHHEWVRTLHRGGYLAPHWPREFGGPELSLEQQVVLNQEMARADAPELRVHMISLNHAGATLMHFGTPEQQQHLAAILEGEIWCQGFSEPNAGSDLAALETRAERHGDVYVVNGQKVWSSMAQFADWALLLARTDPDAPKRRGISYFMLDVHSPGVELRPIRQITGDAEFCEMFLTDVEIPVENRFGEEGDGWRMAQLTLASERGPAVVDLQLRLRSALDDLAELASTSLGIGAGTSALDDADVRQELGALHAEVEVLGRLCGDMVDDIVRHGEPGPASSTIKVVYSELLQRLTGLGERLSGLPGQRDVGRGFAAAWTSGDWLLDYIGSWTWTIAGGTNEIQRNVIAERVLGLPREPSMS
ncbi:MAG: acyl-CoA dehydrogenase family protein [Acidimicrobiia bacterium]